MSTITDYFPVTSYIANKIGSEKSKKSSDWFDAAAKAAVIATCIFALFLTPFIDLFKNAYDGLNQKKFDLTGNYETGSYHVVEETWGEHEPLEIDPGTPPGGASLS